MADKQLSALPAASTAIALTDLLLMTVGADSRKVTPMQLASAMMSLVGMYSSFAIGATDLNTLPNSGMYQIALADAPTGNAPESTACFCLQSKLDANRTAQFALAIASGTIYWRSRTSGGTWTSWQRGLNSSLLQTSTTDITAGALLSVGSFGLGSDALTVTDFDALAVTGFYRGTSTTTGTPISGTNGWVCEHINYASSNASQVAHRATVVTTGAHYVRTRVGGIWGSWETQYSSGNILGTVSMVSGVPTGAVIQSGANANGAYLKFASGDMICTTADRTVTAVNTADGTLFKSADFTWTYPSAFIAPPVLSPGGTDDLDCFVVTKLPVSSAVGVARLKSTITKSVTVTFGLIARGKWA